MYLSRKQHGHRCQMSTKQMEQMGKRIRHDSRCQFAHQLYIFFDRSTPTSTKKHATDHPCLHTDKVRVNQSRHANDSSSRSRQESCNRIVNFPNQSIEAIGTLEHGLYHSNPIATRTSTATAASSS